MVHRTRPERACPYSWRLHQSSFQPKPWLAWHSSLLGHLRSWIWNIGLISNFFYKFQVFTYRRCCLSFPSKKSATNFLMVASSTPAASGLNLAMSSSNLINLIPGNSSSLMPKNSRILLWSSSSVLMLTNKSCPLYSLAMAAAVSCWAWNSGAFLERKRRRWFLMTPGTIKN